MGDDEQYEETRKVLETCDLEDGLQLWMSGHETGTEGPGRCVSEPLWKIRKAGCKNCLLRRVSKILTRDCPRKIPKMPSQYP